MCEHGRSPNSIVARQGGRKLGRIVAGSDGRLWVTEPLRDRVAAVTTAGTVTEYPVPPGTVPFEITSGPDGALW